MESNEKEPMYLINRESIAQSVHVKSAEIPLITNSFDPQSSMVKIDESKDPESLKEEN